MATKKRAASKSASKPRKAAGAGQKDHKGMKNWKPGSDPSVPADKAPGDFGAPAGDEDTIERDYVSQNTKHSDPGAAQPRSGETARGTRTSGAGAHANGPGSGSGGDIDTDIIGTGTGKGLAESGPDDPPGADDVTSDQDPTDTFASGGHAQGSNETGAHRVGGSKRVKGSTVTAPDDRSIAPVGADAATNAARGDDSFAGEISSGEASGQDGTT